MLVELNEMLKLGLPGESTCCSSGPPSTRVQNCENGPRSAEVSVRKTTEWPVKSTRK